MGNTINMHAQLTYPSRDADDDDDDRSAPVSASGRNLKTLRVPAHPLASGGEVRPHLAELPPTVDSMHEAEGERPSRRPTSRPSYRPTRRVPQALAPASSMTAGELESHGSYSQIVARRRT